VWVDRQQWGYLRVGDLVLLTDTARSITSQLAWVEGRADDEDGTTLTLVLEEDPLTR
jgi:hypothetical protein